MKRRSPVRSYRGSNLIAAPKREPDVGVDMEESGRRGRGNSGDDESAAETSSPSEMTPTTKVSTRAAKKRDCVRCESCSKVMQYSMAGEGCRIESRAGIWRKSPPVMWRE